MNSSLDLLSRAQRAALRHVSAQAAGESAGHRAALAALLDETGTPRSALDDALASLRTHARVALNFHPDRLSAGGRSVAENLFRDGVYRNQFETGISSGGLSAFRGGDRDRWEANLFGGAYQASDVRPEERPRYGALDVLRYADGPAPRFGSCYLVLNPAAADHCTFTFGDSHQPTGYVGVRRILDGVVLGLLRVVAGGAWDFGISGLSVPAFLDRLRRVLAGSLPDPASQPLGRLLDQYIEAQVHGRLHLGADVEMLVADPSFRDGPTGRILEVACDRYDVVLRWHPGFTLPVRLVCSTFRGPAIPRLARRIAGDGVIDAAAIGRAAASLYHEPEAWRDWGSPAEALQHLKQLWHVLVYRGLPGVRARPPAVHDVHPAARANARGVVCRYRNDATWRAVPTTGPPDLSPEASASARQPVGSGPDRA